MLNDELISAYLDGELDEEKRALVDHWLASDPGAAARYQRIRYTDGLLRSAIPRVATDPHDPIAELIRTGKPVRNMRSLATSDWARRAAALAAACLIGVLAGRLVGVSPSSQLPGLTTELSPEIARFLDQSSSGQAGRVSGTELQTALTIATPVGRLCREFRMTSRDQAVDALACHDQGQWRVIVQALAPEDSESYELAASGGPTPIEAAIEAMGGAEVVDAADERDLIRTGWRR